MGLFDFLKKKNSTPPPADTKTSGRPPGDKNVARLGRVVADKLAQNYDRMEAIEALSRVHSEEAAAALLKRFSFSIEPSITDQEEKEVAYHGVVACGEEAIAPVLRYCEKAESLTWALKILKEILPPGRYIEEIVDLLDAHDTDWSRNVDPKLHLIRALEGQKNAEVKEVLQRFLEDVSEPVRFQATIALFSTEDDTLLPKIFEKIAEEESMRLVVKIAESVAFRGWSVPLDYRQPFARALRSSPAGYDVSEDGRVVQ